MVPERPPRPELEARLFSLREALRDSGLEGALLTHPLSIFYFTGAFARAHLLVTERQLRFLVFRPLERVRRESPFPAEPFRSLKGLPGLLREAGLRRVGLEFASLSHRDFLRYQDLLQDFELSDLSGIISSLRQIKSPYERACLREAGRRLAEALSAALPRLKPGMTELEALAEIETELRRRGHPGLVRSARGNEFATGLLVSGPEAVEPTYMVAGEGGRGVPGFPSGASLKEIRPGEPVLVDVAGYFAGYYVDQTRMLVFGKPSREVQEYLEIAEALMATGKRLLRPGVSAEEVYYALFGEAERLGVSEFFMRHGEEGVNFVGHGVGLCVDEDPPLAPGVKTPLRAGMCLALEPKLHIPGLGVIGFEDTWSLEEDSAEKLTVFLPKFKIISCQ
ncbi:aminopeptidase P family protein [Thermosulfurimonas marina]|uniref:Aminopeptidase P family protein n=1 Tax=Thermosulfurimonas marina TaxID=2047767 RepID=A0A6H1WR04_9BACT|nr:Xaa-Pro peptidase family protein [Thermosulfurimonas marina]QJA05598.1 aminopeptidase P family protein [Thermosulfurimonas marina]